MRKKKFLSLLLAFSLLAACASCGKQEIPTDFGDDYVPGYDDSLNEYHGTVAFSDPILYVYAFLNNDFIYCFDFETGESYPLCSKPNCLHNSEDCNAYNPHGDICLCEDRIIAVDDTGTAWYFRMDGSGSDILGQLIDRETYENSYSSVGFGYNTPIAHRGYIYCGFILFQKEKLFLRLCRLPASGGSSEIVWEQGFPIGDLEEGVTLYNIFLTYSGRGNKIYFTYHNGLEASSLCSYDIETGEVALLRESQPRFEVIYLANGQWYYMTKYGVYCWNPETGEERCLVTFSSDFHLDVTKWSGLRFYEGGFLLPDEDEPDTFVFYDWDGNVTHRVKIDDVPPGTYRFLLGHFDNYLLCEYRNLSTGSTGSASYTIAVLDTDHEAFCQVLFFLYGRK